MPVPCARCNMPLPQRELAAGGSQRCTLCGAVNHARVFPAALSAPMVSLSETALEGEAACYDHPSKRAIAACSQCGRFVCQLCAVEFGPEIWCPACVAAGAGKARAANQVTSRQLYDSMALILPLVTLLVWPFTALAAPVSMVTSVLKWSQPLSLVRRSRWRFVAAILISTAEIVAWCWGIFYIASGRLSSLQ